jgi:O-acetyl-ADP-ribose deacetylase (regulator of RNase III)
MERQLSEWKLEIERIWSAAAPDYHEAACLAAEIASLSGEAMLRQAATQALPILRSAAEEAAGQVTKDAAHRRLGVIREVLHTLTTPRFGRRETPAKAPTLEQCYRQLLGLPFDRGLTVTEIHRAFKRAAKTAHPDAGGNAQAFLELTAARDALMHPGAKKRG